MCTREGRRRLESTVGLKHSCILLLHLRAAKVLEKFWRVSFGQDKARKLAE